MWFASEILIFTNNIDYDVVFLCFHVGKKEKKKEEGIFRFQENRYSQPRNEERYKTFQFI